MKASVFLKMFGWCGGSIVPSPAITIDFSGETAEIYLSANGNVKWRWKKAQQNIKVDLQTDKQQPQVETAGTMDY